MKGTDIWNFKSIILMCKKPSAVKTFHGDVECLHMSDNNFEIIQIFTDLIHFYHISLSLPYHER